MSDGALCCCSPLGHGFLHPAQISDAALLGRSKDNNFKHKVINAGPVDVAFGADSSHVAVLSKGEHAACTTCCSTLNAEPTHARLQELLMQPTSACWGQTQALEDPCKRSGRWVI